MFGWAGRILEFFVLNRTNTNIFFLFRWAEQIRTNSAKIAFRMVLNCSELFWIVLNCSDLFRSEQIWTNRVHRQITNKSEQFGTIRNESEQNIEKIGRRRTIQNNSEQFGTILNKKRVRNPNKKSEHRLNKSDQIRTNPNNSEQFRTIPNNSEQIWTARTRVFGQIILDINKSIEYLL